MNAPNNAEKSPGKSFSFQRISLQKKYKQKKTIQLPPIAQDKSIFKEFLPEYEASYPEITHLKENYTRLRSHMETFFDYINEGTYCTAIADDSESNNKEILYSPILTNSSRMDKQKALLQSMLGIVDQLGQFIIPMHESYKERIGDLLKLSILQNLEYTSKLKNYIKSQKKGISI